MKPSSLCAVLAQNMFDFCFLWRSHCAFVPCVNSLMFPLLLFTDKLLPLSSLPNVGREHGGKSRQRRRVSEKRKVEVDATKATGRAGSMQRQFEEEEEKESNGRQLDESRALVVVDTPHAEVHKGRSVVAMEISPARMLSEPLPLTVQSSFPPVSMFRSGQQYPCTPQTTTGAQRELRILQRLQVPVNF